MKYLTDFSYSRKASEIRVAKKETNDTFCLEGSMPEIEIVKEISLTVESYDDFILLDVIVKCLKTGNMYATCSQFINEYTEKERDEKVAERELWKSITFCCYDY